ncbi:hypothetical protein H6P81_015145 [Aristolochia fimbriata]|uniref:Uncharacterized protein n=1 Tax=Aristolochia fimbriata TaxID=158543 RepID=A0AAV7E4F4_ARIFI|nr:hypothetical protein H6P81_015145 [Aristolochia fimbriata]
MASDARRLPLQIRKMSSPFHAHRLLFAFALKSELMSDLILFIFKEDKIASLPPVMGQYARNVNYNDG